MICGLCRKYRQLIGFHLTGKSFDPDCVAEWLKEMLQKLSSIGLTAASITMDMSPQNKGI